MHYRIRKLRRLIVIFLLIHLTTAVTSQEMWGLVNSNFSGSNSVLINPSGIVASKLFLDINLATADIFVSNNYLYIHREDYSLFKFLKKDPVWPKYGPDDFAFDHYTSKTPKDVYVNLYVKGPSFMLARGRHAIALHTGVRYLTSLTDIPFHAANLGYYGLDYEEQYNINYHNRNASMGALAFGEVGLTYAYAFRKYAMEDWSAGITLRRLFGISGSYLYANDIDYTLVNDSTMDFKNLNAEAGFSMPLDYNNNDFPDAGPRIKGGGYAFDLGVTFQRKLLSYQKRRITKMCRQRYSDYIYKIGFSLLDIGYVKFTENAQAHAYNDVGRYWYNIDTLSYYNMNQMMGTLSDVFYGDPQASYQGDQFSVFLPAAVSLQADYKFYRNWYGGGVFIHPLRISKSMVYRPTQIMLAPRYETPHFEASLPVSLYEWRYPRVGFSLRYHFFSIGTDNLAWLFGVSDFTGIDFYFSVKFNFRKGNCIGLGREVPCENDEYGYPRKR